MTSVPMPRQKPGWACIPSSAHVHISIHYIDVYACSQAHQLRSGIQHWRKDKQHLQPGPDTSANQLLVYMWTAPFVPFSSFSMLVPLPVPPFPHPWYSLQTSIPQEVLCDPHVLFPQHEPIPPAHRGSQDRLSPWLSVVDVTPAASTQARKWYPPRISHTSRGQRASGKDGWALQWGRHAGAGRCTTALSGTGCVTIAVDEQLLFPKRGQTNPCLWTQKEGTQDKITWASW